MKDLGDTNQLSGCLQSPSEWTKYPVCFQYSCFIFQPHVVAFVATEYQNIEMKAENWLAEVWRERSGREGQKDRKGMGIEVGQIK